MFEESKLNDGTKEIEFASWDETKWHKKSTCADMIRTIIIFANQIFL